MLKATILPLLFGILASQAALAGPDAKERQHVIDLLSAELAARYVFPDKVPSMTEALRLHEEQGAYGKAGGGEQFAELLTHDLREIAHDAHLTVGFHPIATTPSDEVYAQEDGDGGGKTRMEPVPANLKTVDCRPGKTHYFYFGSVECLPGNIGYLKLYSFPEKEGAVDVMAAAMSQIARTDVLIVDVRENGGGDPETVALLASYLFDEKTHVNDIYRRKTDRLEEYWTNPAVSGMRFGQHKDVYVLIGPNTPSAAEELSYDLKTLHRATLVGERTWGGANPGELIRLDEHYDAFIPFGSAVNPITKTNWEGVGVTPDIPVSVYDALELAEVTALKKLIADPNNKHAAQLQKRLKQIAQSGAP